MNTTRRNFLKSAALSGASAAVLVPRLSAVGRPAPSAPSFVVGRSPMHLGTVTYNLAKNWDIATIIKNCTEAEFEGVELRTTHRHGVEVTLGKAERAEVKRRFSDSPVRLWSLGSAFEYHTPDQAKLRADIEATKEYLVLAHDVGATGIKVRPNGLPPEVPVERTLEQIGRSLGELGRFAESYNQELRLEVHGRGTALVPHIRRIMDVANHPLVGVCWNCNPTDLEGAGFDANFDLVKDRINLVHMRDLFITDYPFRRLFYRLRAIGYTGYCLAEIPESSDPLRVMKYYRSLWLAYQDLL
jgi:sugar phosphate isomerase/epimerase